MSGSNLTASPIVAYDTSAQKFETGPLASSPASTAKFANANTLLGASGAVTDSSAAAGLAIAPNNAAIVYSPYNWTAPTSAEAVTINAGAYFKTLFTGTRCTLNFNIANNSAPISQIWYRVDGAGPWTQSKLAATIACTMPASTLSNAEIPYHLLEVVVKSTSETINRWNSPSNTAVVFTGLTIAAGAAVAPPTTFPLNALFYGDSLTEGVRALGESATNDTDCNDARGGWAYRLGELMGAEFGIVGFGGSGLTVKGSGNVPALPTSYNQIMNGVPRTFSPTPTFIYLNAGTNDRSANTVSAMTAVLNGLIAACPDVPIIVQRPFKGSAQAANLQSAIEACTTPAQCSYIDTTGILDAAYGVDSLNLHPTAPNNITRIAPALLVMLRPLIVGSAGNHTTTTTAASGDMAVVIKSGAPQTITLSNLKAAVAATPKATS